MVKNGRQKLLFYLSKKMLSKTLQIIYIALYCSYCLSNITENKNYTPYMKKRIILVSRISLWLCHK